MPTEQALFELYQSKFKPLYADLVAVTGEKSLIIDAQIESAMSHLAVSRTNGDEAAKRDNLNAAHSHVLRACLDAAKLYWLSRFNRVKFLLKDPQVKSWCLNITSGEFNRLHVEAETAIRDARRSDAANAGHGDEQAIQKYLLAIQKYEAILASVDNEKLDNIKRFNLMVLMKSQAIGFIVGVAASVVAAIVYDMAKK